MKKYLNISLPSHLKDSFEPYRVLILEDDENRIGGFRKLFTEVGANIIWVDTAEECIYALKNNGPFDIVFLDHDLGGKIFVPCDHKNTGSEVARWIDRNPLDSNTIVVIHSGNSVGSKYMNELIPSSHRIPFAWSSGIGTIGYKK